MRSGRLRRRPKPRLGDSWPAALALMAFATAGVPRFAASAEVPLPPVQPRPEPARPTEDLAPAYEPELERLAELLGTLAFMRELCGSGDGPEWRRQMGVLLDAEAPAEPRRSRLAGYFNRGFRGYQATYRFCTPSAALVVTRSLDEGGRLARQLESRYSGG